ncbi:MAG: dTMP kinase [Vulcanimicrobiaceae bacterium]
MFISFEGIEGSGKSTLLREVAERLRSEGRSVVETREPGGTAVGDRVRQLFLEPGLPIGAMAETFLINASRAQLVADVIRPALDAGNVVLCDRYVDSTLAYQGYARELGIAKVRSLCEAATGGLYPDLTLLVDVTVETSRKRVDSRNGGSDRVDAQDGEFHERTRQGFLELARTDRRIAVLNGEQSEALVLEAAMAIVSKLAT